MSLITVWSAHTPDLHHYQWKNRIVLIFEPSATDERIKRQTALIEANSSGFHDRDLLAFLIPEGSSLRARFRVADNTFVVILLGKDGTEKLRQQTLLEPEKLFHLVDSMPMRQAGGR